LTSTALSDLQPSVAGRQMEGSPACPDCAAHVLRIKAADQTDREIRSKFAIAGARVDLAVEIGGKRDTYSTRAAPEFHVASSAQRLHPYIDVAVPGIGRNRTGRRRYVYASVARR